MTRFCAYDKSRECSKSCVAFFYLLCEDEMVIDTTKARCKRGNFDLYKVDIT